jgi:hypothetical protein
MSGFALAYLVCVVLLVIGIWFLSSLPEKEFQEVNGKLTSSETVESQNARGKRKTLGWLMAIGGVFGFLFTGWVHAPSYNSEKSA